MAGQQALRIHPWDDFVRGRLWRSLGTRLETKCSWSSILDKQLIVDLKRNIQYLLPHQQHHRLQQKQQQQVKRKRKVIGNDKWIDKQIGNEKR